MTFDNIEEMKKIGAIYQNSNPLLRIATDSDQARVNVGTVETIILSLPGLNILS